jgi:hypothetical protein
MDVNKVLYHLQEADKELNRITQSNCSSDAYGHQSYLVAMSNIYDFVLSIKSTESNSVVRDDY